MTKLRFDLNIFAITNIIIFFSMPLMTPGSKLIIMLFVSLFIVNIIRSSKVHAGLKKKILVITITLLWAYYIIQTVFLLSWYNVINWLIAKWSNSITKNLFYWNWVLFFWFKIILNSIKLIKHKTKNNNNNNSKKETMFKNYKQHTPIFLWLRT